MRVHHLCTTLIFIIINVVKLYGDEESAAERCFCKLKGELDDCDCKIEQLLSFNNLRLYPILSVLVTKSYFRFFRVNLKKACPFWTDDFTCAMRNCAVKGCADDEVPSGLKKEEQRIRHEKLKYLKPNVRDASKCTDDNHGGLGTLDTYLSDESKAAFENWSNHDDQQNTFCELDDDQSEGLQYVDLKKNPERYTGYAGKSAHRIWDSIYKENCFEEQPASPYGQGNLAGPQCLEKRVFYRLISGLHASINVHLCHEYLLKDERVGGRLMSSDGQVWGPNVDEFQRRFDPKFTPQGPQRLRNLFFTLLLELRALYKVSGYLRSSQFFTGSTEEDEDTQKAMTGLLSIVNKFPDHFDETRLFRSKDSHPLYKEFRDHFRNISRIMDCVGCHKCRLWGKLQVTGMGTALKILVTPQAVIDEGPPRFQLRRGEIVALVNAVSRLSQSMKYTQAFKTLLKDRK